MYILIRTYYRLLAHILIYRIFHKIITPMASLRDILVASHSLKVMPRMVWDSHDRIVDDNDTKCYPQRQWVI